MRFFLLLFLLFTTGLLAQDLTLDVNQVVELALKQNLDFKMSAAKLARMDQAVREARAQKWATLDFESAYAHISEVMKIDFSMPTIPGLPVKIPSQSIQFGDGNELEFYLQVFQPLYTGGALKANAQAATQEMLGQKFQIQAQKNHLEFAAQKLFYSMAKALEFKKITLTSIDQIRAHLNDVNQFYQQGQVTRNELLTVEVKLSQAELMLAQAEKNIELVRLALAVLLNLDLEQKINIAYDPNTWEHTDTAPAPLQPDLKPEIIAFRHQLDGLRFRQDALRGGRRPGLGLFARYVYAKPGLNKVANEWMDYWMVGVNLKWNLWDWGRKSAQIQQVQSRVDEMQWGFQQLQRTLTADAEQTRLNLADARYQLQISRKMQTQAEENFRIVSNRFNQGLETNSAFLDAQADLTRSQLQLVQQQIDCQIAQADYQRAISGE